MEKEYKKISKDTKDAAERILKPSSLEDKLSKIGKVSIIGSYKYDLMYGPDIDIIVETANPRVSVLKAFETLFHTKYFQKLELGDFENFPRKDRPKSYILVLETVDKDVKWEIEIWFHKQYPRDIAKLDELMKNITDRERDTILRIKDQRACLGKSKKDLSSVEIYNGVLLQGKKDLKDF